VDITLSRDTVKTPYHATAVSIYHGARHATTKRINIEEIVVIRINMMLVTVVVN